ncbi:hypothetical protein B0H63DRAFT_515982 [Podospora didyma]|uniref:Uncharacterized protein n=1 Tax=Podospora didyma TaxID=330526 RepID=A0AAE0P3Y3_9PEZI|nr:hypothetical protein B0H63DRAFT_515982 [Podospora didyma]
MKTTLHREMPKATIPTVHNTHVFFPGAPMKFTLMPKANAVSEAAASSAANVEPNPPRLSRKERKALEREGYLRQHKAKVNKKRQLKRDKKAMVEALESLSLNLSSSEKKEEDATMTHALDALTLDVGASSSDGKNEDFMEM